MQRTILVLVLSCFLTHPWASAAAEEMRTASVPQRRVQPSVMFGLAVGDLVADPHKPHELTLGGTIGAGIEYAWSDRTQLQVRGLLLDKASFYTDVMQPRPQDFYDVTLSFRYVAVPVLVKVRPMRSGLYVLAGPELAFRARARQVFARYRDASTLKEVVNLDLTRALGPLNRMDIALAGGVGLERGLGRVGWVAEVYASRGLRNVLREGGHEQFGFRADSVHTESVAFLTGIRF